MKRVNIITGHYGSGKTNFSVNLALRLAEQGKKVCLVDLDIVNPYFRAADSTELLERHGVRVLASMFANTNLDIPAVPSEINLIFDDKSYTIVLDVGGDDAGAAALGQFSEKIRSEDDYRHLYVFNARRPLTKTPQQALTILREIEKISRIPADALVNNTNLSFETTTEVLADSITYAEELADLSGLPVEITTIKKGIAPPSEIKSGLLPVDIYVKQPWS